jgi:exonuclease III
MSTLNVNGVSAMMRMRKFLHKQEIDILLLQEVTHTDFNMMTGYNAYTNVGINKRGTAMLTKETIKLTKITRLPSGRGMAAYCRGVWIVNAYGPSGSSYRHQRDIFTI